MFRKKLLIGIASIAIIAACKKEETKDLTVEIISPTQNEIDVHTTFTIKVVGTDVEEMHEVRAYLIKIPQNDTIWEEDKHSHSKSVTLEEIFEFEHEHVDGEEQTIKLVAEAENDAGKIVTKSKNILVHNHDEH